MKILITGAAGTLGLPLLNALCERGHEVIGCDLKHTNDARIKRCDIRHLHRLEKMFADFAPEIVFDFAAEFGRKNGQDFYEDLWTTNCIGTRNVIECCKAHDSFLVFASSSEAYGTLAEDGILYEDLLHCAMPKFYNEYALSKLTNEKQIQLSGVRHLILRIFNVYGPGEHYTQYRSVIARFLHLANKGYPLFAWKGERTFLYVDDFIRAICSIPAKLDSFSGEIINCADDERIEIPFLAEVCSELCGSQEVRKDDETEPRNTPKKIPDISKFKNLLGYKKTVSLEEGLKRTHEWMRAND